MKATFCLFLYGLTLFLTTAWGQAKAISDPFFSAYKGNIGGSSVQLLLEQEENQLEGLYYEEQNQQTLYLTGTIQESGDFELKEWTTPSPNDEDRKQTGIFRGTWSETNPLSGTWVAENGKKNALFHLTKQKKQQLTPEQLKEALTQASSSAVLQFLVANYIIEGIDFRYLYYGDGHQTPYTNIHPNNMQIDLFGCNLFGDQKVESVLQVRFNNWLYLIAAFYPTTNQWKKVPNYLHFNRGNTTNQPCRTTVPSEHYFLFSLVEAQKANEYVLEGRVYGGDCSGERRGDEIYYYVWNIDKKGIHLAYNEIEMKYSYVSSTSKALEEPVDIQFQWVSSSNQGFPRQLKRKEVHYQFHAERELITDQPIGYTTKIGETTTTIQLF